MKKSFSFKKKKMSQQQNTSQQQDTSQQQNMSQQLIDALQRELKLMAELEKAREQERKMRELAEFSIREYNATPIAYNVDLSGRYPDYHHWNESGSNTVFYSDKNRCVMM